MKPVNLWFHTPIANLYFYLVKIIETNPQLPHAYNVQHNVNTNLYIYEKKHIYGLF